MAGAYFMSIVHYNLMVEATKWLAKQKEEKQKKKRNSSSGETGSSPTQAVSAPAQEAPIAAFYTEHLIETTIQELAEELSPDEDFEVEPQINEEEEVEEEN